MLCVVYIKIGSRSYNYRTTNIRLIVSYTHTIWSHHCSNSHRHKQQCWYRNCSCIDRYSQLFHSLNYNTFYTIKTEVVRVHNLIWAIKRVSFFFVSIKCLFCFDFKHLNSKIIEESHEKNVTDSGLFIVYIIISSKKRYSNFCYVDCLNKNNGKWIQFDCIQPSGKLWHYSVRPISN